jgi:DNA repair protein RecO (recombination protein O)
MKAAELHRCWLLHARPYRDTSLLLDLFTQEEGRVGAIARGVRAVGKGKAISKRSLLQPFVPLQVSLSGRGDLRTLGQTEALSAGVPLLGERLLSALYVNELLVRLLPAHEKEAEVFDDYSRLLYALAGNAGLEPLLRSFELQLLDVLGYGLQLTHEVVTGEIIHADAWYQLQGEGGFIRQPPGVSDTLVLYAGNDLMAMARRDFSNVETRRAAKRLLRTALQQQLGSRELASRALFAKPALPTSTP